MRVVVVGAGAIGSLFGGLLSEVDLDVTLIGRPPHVRAIRSKGLHLEGISGKKTIRVRAEVSPSAVREYADIVLCTVKAYDTKQAAIDSKPLIREDSLFLCLQNGLDVEKEAVDVLGPTKVARGVTNNGALFIKPGYVKHTGLGETVVGCPSQRWRSRINKFIEALNTIGLPATMTEDIQRTVWSKALINAGINAIGAITRLRNGQVVRNPNLKNLMKSAIEEGLKVADRLGISLMNENIIEKTFKVAEATALNKNSMLQDIENGKRTEIDFINGAIAKIGESIGMSTPINNALAVLVKGLEMSIGKYS